MSYSRRHYQRLSNGGPDLPWMAAERIRARRAGELAVVDRETRYPVLTSENAGEAMAYQEARIAFHVAELAAGRER